MTALVEQMKVVLATTFSFYLKAQNFHWNVEGIQFPYLHDLFGKIYEDAHDDVDQVAEHIRALDSYAPGSLGRFSELTKINDVVIILNGMQMVSMLSSDNTILIDEMKKALRFAEQEKQDGIQNFLQDKIDQREKLGWMLRATKKV